MDQRGSGVFLCGNDFITMQKGASLMGIFSLDRVQLCQFVLEM